MTTLLCPFLAVRTAVCDHLGLLEDEVRLENSLVDDYGADREELLEIVCAVERTLGLQLDPTGWFDRGRRILALVTVDHLVRLVAAALPAATSPLVS
jgi:acyl carrier protein